MQNRKWGRPLQSIVGALIMPMSRSVAVIFGALALLGVVAVASASSATYLACEGNSSATFKAELKIRPYNCVAVGGSLSSTARLAHMHWSRWNSAEAAGTGKVIANHAVLISGREVFMTFPIRVRLFRPGHQCDGSQANFTRLEWRDEFGTGTDTQVPDCP